MFCLVFQFLQSVPKLTLANWSLGDYLMLPFSNLAHCPASSVWFCPPGECKYIIGYTSMRTLLGSCNCQRSSIFRLLKREKPETEASEILVSREFSRIFFYFHFSFSILSRFNFNFHISKTRPSALGMSDPIWGLLIHNFVDEKKIEKDKDLDQVNCEYIALRFLNF